MSPHTRSGLIPAANPSFDLTALIAQSIYEQDLAEELGLFSLSPLTQSPTSSPDSSPTLLPTSLAGPSKKTEGLTELALARHLTPTQAPILLANVRPSRPFKATRPTKPPPKPKNPDRILTQKRKDRRNAAASNARAKKRERLHSDPVPHPHGVALAQERYVDTAAVIECDVDVKNLPIADGAYIGINTGGNDRTPAYSLDDLVGPSAKKPFRLQRWDGSESMGLVDKKYRLIGVLAGHPLDANWPALQREAAAALESRRSRCKLSKKSRENGHRRGGFVALACGVSHGGGQRRPTNLHNDPPNVEVLEELNKMEPFQRIAGFSSSVLRSWAPDLHDYYLKTTTDLHDKHPQLKRIFPCGIFCSCTYNLGPRTVCFKHKDKGNLAFGMCSVTTFGDFDYTKGGHLVLWDLEVVIEFPPGSTILLPSAIVAHSNIRVAKDEHRYSFVQYTAGGIFRWVENEFQNQDDHKLSLSAEQLEQYNKRRAGRLEFGLSLLPILSPSPFTT